MTVSNAYEYNSERVPGDFFIGRVEELKQILQFLKLESTDQVLEICTHGAGGIGKTKLLEQVLARCKDSADDYLVTQEFIDFYHTACRSRLGVLQELARTLGLGGFPEFAALASNYLQERDPSKRKKNLSNIEKTFIREYTNFIKGRQPILFFDTYEFIQRTPLPGETVAEGTGLSRWLETKFSPELLKASPATRIIVSGRYSLQDIPRSQIAVKSLELQPFEIQDTTQFLQQCFGYSNQQELIGRIGSAEELGKIQALSNGHPILLALFVDWVNYPKNPLSPREFIATIEADTTHDQHTVFEKTLIKRVSELASPEDIAVIAMAVAYHRMTPAMFQALTPEVSASQCQDIFDQLRRFSFVKRKTPNIVVLHDEMRRMVVEWLFNDPQDKSRFIRKAIVEELVQYYDGLLKQPGLSDTEREIYTTEQLEYAFIADLEAGLIRFRTEFEENFDTYIDDGKYDYCDMLLRDTEMIHRENPGLIPFPDHVMLDWRRIQYNNDSGGDSQESIDVANAVLERYQDEPTFRNHRSYGHILMQRGIAEFWIEQFDQARSSLRLASKEFLKRKEPIALYMCTNWIGYSYYRQSKFSQAEHYYEQSREGLYEQLRQISQRAKNEPQTKLLNTEYRSLLQGIQLSFGNLAILYHYLGRVEHAIPYAETALEIARALKENAVEIARIRATLGRIFAGVGLSIDAGHHLRTAEKILREDVEDPFLEGRVKTDLGILSYRGSELERILEYYRAGDIARIVKRYASTSTGNPAKGDFTEDNRPDLAQAEKDITDAINTLGEKGEEKERADAYYARGELYIVMPADDHWQRAEDDFLKALRLAQKSQFEYRVIDTLESLVTLYYFWNGDPDVPEEQKPRTCRVEQLASYQQKLDQFHQKNPECYPDLIGKYYITLGDHDYDTGCSCLNTDKTEFTAFIEHFIRAFGYYRSAIALMKAFHADAYYGALGVFYNRLRMLVNDYPEHPTLLPIFDQLHNQPSWMTETDENVRILYDHTRILLTPSEDSLQQQIRILQADIQTILDQGNFGRALLLTDCVIAMYHALLRIRPDHDGYQEELIFQIRAKSVYYRRLGNTYQANQYLSQAQTELDKLQKMPLQHLPQACVTALVGTLKAVEGTLLYRRGGFEQILEFYLCDELDMALRKFDAEFGETVRNQALQLLKDGEVTLVSAMNSWEQQAVGTKHEHLYQRYRAQLGETHFRLGELLMLHENFTSSAEFQNMVFEYFQQAIADADASNDAYLRENARQSWFSALYLSGLSATNNFAKTQQELKEQLERMAHSGDKAFPSVMGKFRIKQGDMLFSSLFQYKERTGKEGKFYDYIRRKDIPIVFTTVQEMLEHYVEACDFMAQHGSQDFAAALRTLQRRIELIADVDTLQEIHDGLMDAWNIQEHLSQYTEELRTLRQFAQLRRIILEYETQN